MLFIESFIEIFPQNRDIPTDIYSKYRSMDISHWRIQDQSLGARRARIYNGGMGAEPRAGSRAPGLGAREKLLPPPDVESFLHLHNLRSWPICPKIWFLQHKKISSDVWGGSSPCPLDPPVHIVSQQTAIFTDNPKTWFLHRPHSTYAERRHKTLCEATQHTVQHSTRNRHLDETHAVTQRSRIPFHTSIYTV